MPLSNFTLLYIEDDKEMNEHMKMMLEDDVKEFYQAFDGEEGLSIYEEKKPDIILSDINMPKLDGLSMSKRIKKNNKSFPIIIISAFDDTKILLNAINIGIDYFIPKPINMELLNYRLEVIAQHLQNKIDLEEIRQKKIDDLQKLAHFDSLTNIPNRFLFDIKLDEVINKTKRDNSSFAIFFLDLDDFKKVNDTYGHLAGDKVLCSIAKSIKSIIRMEDTFARISGDEFLLIIENIEEKQTIDFIAKKIIDTVSKSIRFEKVNITIGCSIGISIYPEDSVSKKELLHLADLAMYKAKKSGKSNYVYFNKLIT